MDKKAKIIALKARKQVFGSLSGIHLSPLKGEGFEFSELREYEIGDDVKKIDWKTTAKLRKPYVKIYQDEKDLNVVVSTMLSGSTYFGTDIQKKDFMIEIIALLGYSAVRNRDFFSHILFADKLYSMSKPSKKIFAVNSVIEECVKFNVLGKPANYPDWIDTLYKKIRKKSLLFLIGDFVGNINLSLLAKKHDLYVIMVRDRFIENPKPLGEVTLVDPGYLTSFSGNVDETSIKTYVNALKENDAKFLKHIKEIGARFAKIYTDQKHYIEILKSM